MIGGDEHDARTAAEKILADARSEAERVLAKAKVDADRLAHDAEQLTERLVSEARRDSERLAAARAHVRAATEAGSRGAVTASVKRIPVP